MQEGGVVTISKVSQDSHDWLTRSGRFSTHGSRRGTSDFASDGFDPSMSTDPIQQWKTLHAHQNNLRKIKKAAEKGWYGSSLTVNQIHNYKRRIRKNKNYIPKFDGTKSERAQKREMWFEWIRVRGLITELQKHMQRNGIRFDDVYRDGADFEHHPIIRDGVCL